jgi:hypothetical protein
MANQGCPHYPDKETLHISISNEFTGKGLEIFKHALKGVNADLTTIHKCVEHPLADKTFWSVVVTE